MLSVVQQNFRTTLNLFLPQFPEHRNSQKNVVNLRIKNLSALKIQSQVL